MLSWLGEKIEVGSVVGRGARNGNTSAFHLGIVTEVDPDKLKARVKWKYVPRPMWNDNPSGRYHADGVTPLMNRELFAYSAAGRWREDNKGSWNTIESLFVLPPETLARAEKLKELSEEYYKRKHKPDEMTTQEFLDRAANL